jgi:hypothetical protein
MLSVPDRQQLQHRATGGAEQLASVLCHSTVRQAQRVRVETAGARRIVDWKDCRGSAQN